MSSTVRRYLIVTITLLALIAKPHAEQIHLVCDAYSMSERNFVKNFIFIDTDAKYAKMQEPHFAEEFRDGFVGPIVTGGDYLRFSKPPVLKQFVQIKENEIKFGATGPNIHEEVTLDRSTGFADSYYHDQFRFCLRLQ